MAMFTKLILIFTAMAMVATALVVSPNMTSRCTRSMHKRTPLPHDSDVNTPNTLRKNLETGESENTYTAQQIEQFQAGHNDALWLCKTVIEEATNKPDRFDKIFRQYFPFSDRQLVIDVFKAILDADGEGKGSPEFRNIDIVDNYPSIHKDKDLMCDGGEVALTGTKQDDPGQHRVQIILCPPFFIYGTIQGGPNREWPGILTAKCSNIAYRASHKMDTLGSFLLHEYTHVDEIVQPLLCKHVGDHEYGYYDTRQLALTEPELTRHNADSYASFAAELTWSKVCNRDFEEPIEDDPPRRLISDTKQTDTKESADTKKTDTKGSDTKQIDTHAVVTKQQRPRNEIQSVPSLNKRAPFSRPYEYPIPKVEEGYILIDRRDQYLDAHIDALHLCSVVIEQATRDPDRFDKIFREYFKPDDRELVLDVFKAILDYDGAKHGSPHFSRMKLVPDHPRSDPNDRRMICADKFDGAITITWTNPKYATDLILCYWFFQLRTIGGVPGKDSKSGARPMTCDELGTRLSTIMVTQPHMLLHEYTHVQGIMKPVLGEGTTASASGKTTDYVYGFEECRNLDKGLATRNADSYANFATELFWTMKCDRDFDPPKPDDQYTRRQILEEALVQIGITFTKEQYEAAAGETLEQTLTRLGYLVEIEPVPDEEDTSSEEYSGEEASGAEIFDSVGSGSSGKGDSAAKGGSSGTGDSTAKGSSSGKGDSAAKGGSSGIGDSAAKGSSSGKGGSSAKAGSSSKGDSAAKGGSSSKGARK